MSSPAYRPPGSREPGRQTWRCPTDNKKVFPGTDGVYVCPTCGTVFEVADGRALILEGPSDKR
jgi:hypothetical protein